MASKAAQVREALRQLGTGARVCREDVAPLCPEMTPQEVGTYLTIFTGDQYDLCARAKKVGNRQWYRIKDIPEEKPRAEPKKKAKKKAKKKVNAKKKASKNEARRSRRFTPLPDDDPNGPKRQVTQLLKQLAEGATFDSSDIARATPQNSATRMSAALCELCDQGVLSREAKRGRTVIYRFEGFAAEPPQKGQLLRPDGPPPLDADDPRSLSEQVVEILAEFGVGQVVQTAHVSERIPKATAQNLAPIFRALAAEPYNAITHVGTEGRKNKFRIEQPIVEVRRVRQQQREEDAEKRAKREQDAKDSEGGDSTMSQVHAMLREWGPGQVVRARDVQERAPWLPKNDVSAAMAILSYERYGVLTRLEKEGNVRPYRIEMAVFKEMRHHRRPKYAQKNFEHSDDEAQRLAWISERHRQLNERKRVQCSDLLLAAAEAVEQGEFKQTEDLLRRVYRVLHPKRQKREAAG